MNRLINNGQYKSGSESTFYTIHVQEVFSFFILNELSEDEQITENKKGMTPAEYRQSYLDRL